MSIFITCLAIRQSDWHMEIPQRRPKDSAQVHQTLFLIEGGVWERDYTVILSSFLFITKYYITEYLPSHKNFIRLLEFVIRKVIHIESLEVRFKCGELAPVLSVYFL